MSLSTLYPTSRPSLLLDFINRRRLDSRITFTRASSATYFDANGVLQTAGNDVPRFDFDPATFAPRGLLIEEQRTNSIRNNTMQGAVAGTPGTMPTYWSSPSSTGGLTRELVGTGVSNGITYIDIRYSGTATVTGALVIQPENGTAVVAATGQSWSASAWWAIAGGSTANITGLSQRVTGRSAAGGLLENTDTSVTLSATLTRYVASRTMANASTARVTNDLILNVGAGATIDITLRIGLPQLEQGAFATSVIPTTTAAVTRSGDTASMTGANFSSWFNASEGTFVCGFFINQVAATSRVALHACKTTSLAGVLLLVASNDRVAFDIYDDANSYQGAGGSLPVVNNSTVVVAGAYKTNDASSSFNVNGTLNTPSTDSAVTLATGLDRLTIGGRQSNSVGLLNGHIRRIAYYPSRLTNAQLQALTAS